MMRRQSVVAVFISIVFAIVAFTISVRSFMEKGFLYNNAYIFASEQERKNLDKKPHYRQSAIVFCLIGTIFLLIAIAELSGVGWLYGVVWAVAFITFVYAIASSVKNATKGGKG